MNPKFRIEARKRTTLYYRPIEGEQTAEPAEQVDDILTDDDVAEINASLNKALVITGDMPPHADRCAAVKTIILPYDRS